MLERDPSSGSHLPVDSHSTLLTPSEPVQAVVAVVATDAPRAVGSSLYLDTVTGNAVIDDGDDDDDSDDSPVAESAIVAESAVLAELDNDLRFADLEKASWLPTRPLITAPERHIGTVLGAYRVLELLGKGGMGYVYRAEHIKLGRPVALKLLRTDYGGRKDAITRFFREAKTVNRIRHRNIIDVTDFVELGDGTAFIIMELLQGQSFGKWARSGVDLRRALAVLVQICDGLGAAHTVGVVHRDLKPDNIVVVPLADGTELVKLLDFGVAKLTQRLDGDASYDTQVGALVGTPAYMSPEQAGGMVIDHRSDIYSLGALMYELFCNQPMFRGRSFGEYVRKHLTEVPTLPRSTPDGAAIPVGLEQIIMRCLAKDPNARYDNSFKLRDDLLAVLANIDRPDARTFNTLAFGAQTMKLPVTALVPPASTMPFPHVVLPPVAPATTGISRRSWWIAGSLIAMGGAASAVWMAADATSQPVEVVKATTSEPIVVVQPDTTTAPLEAPTTAPQSSEPTTPPALVELRFNSAPSGSVFAAGHTAELCRTPCAFNVDVKDSESTNSRTFVVRSPGYREQSITIDLSNSQRAFFVELARLPTNGPPNEIRTGSATTIPKTGNTPNRNRDIDQPTRSQVRAGASLMTLGNPRRPLEGAGEGRGTRDQELQRKLDRVPPPVAATADVSEPDPWEALPLEEQVSSLEDAPPKQPGNVSTEPPESPTQGILPDATHNPFQRRR